MPKQIEDVENGISGDESVPYSNWTAYLEAVESGKEKAPKDVKMKKRPDYEFNVDNALDNIDLTFNGYVPSKDAIDFFNVIRLVLGEEPEVSNSLMHYFLVDLVFGNIERTQYPYTQEINSKIRLNSKKIAIIASRFSAKSTIITAYLPIYVAITGKIPNFGPMMFMVGFGDSQQSGAKVQANAIRDFCADSVFCKDYFEKMRFTDEECEFIRKGPERIKKRSFMYKVKGAAGGSVRGIRYRTERPGCHVRGTEVTTEYGTYPVEEHPYKSEDHWEFVKEVKLKGLPTKELVSFDHKYWVKECTSKQIRSRKTRVVTRDYQEYAPKWTSAQELTSNHWIASRIPTEIDEVQTVTFNVSGKGLNRNAKGQLAGCSRKRVDKVHPLMLDDEWWWLYGLWSGDGTPSKGNISWIVANTQENTVGAKVVSILSRLGVAHSTQRFGQGCYSVVASDAAIARWMHAQKEGNSIKTMPNWVLALDHKKQKNILMGYIAAAGFVDAKHNQIRITGVTYKVLIQLQTIASRLGLPTYVRNTKQADIQTRFNGVTCAHKHQWELRLSEGCKDILGFTQIPGSTKVRFKQVHISDGMLWRKVKSVEDSREKHELIPIHCNSKVLHEEHAYETEFGISKNCFLFDDIIKSEADANSPVIMKKLHSMIYADADNALGSKGFVIAVNTPFNKKDPIYSALESGIWTPICLPLCEHIDLELTKEEYISSWPGMHPYEKTMERFEDAYYGGTMREFNQELMLRISSEEDKMVKEDMIQWFSRDMMKGVLEQYTIMITTDFTASNSLKGDFSGIAVWAIGPNDDKFLLDLYLEKTTIQGQYDALFTMVNKWSKNGRLVEVGVEIDGQQQTNVFALKKMMNEKGFWFRFAKQKGAPSGQEGIRSRSAGGNKHERFKYMMPNFEGHRMWLPEELKDTPSMKEMLEELNYITHESVGSKHDDGLDLISQVGLIEYIVPSNSIEPSGSGLTDVNKGIWGSIWKDNDEDKNSVIF